MTDLDERKLLFIQKLIDARIVLKDPQWLDRLDEPAPLWVILDIMMQLIERSDPPYQPFD
ncbi:hypothetical protein [Paenibacillus nasutitermitis]|uniref:Uncharacterized protein n=1 Tax=Paenibacillus nasutitermitis TaxID=1652958 RepID=A0A917DT49_9BACL|nr:hypothetical protein [Paenibacillus nasutitermitis]GGD64668.1 hypothetical protein GCM10010911_23070 [Paenibacillus nasutitermitis]